MAKTRMRIAVGDLFEKTNATRWAWQVREIVTPSGHRPHARLVRFDHPSEARLFSLSALSDKRLFVPAAQKSSEPTNAPSGPAHVRIISNAACQNFSAKAR
jgi:hypothetical protein